MNVTNTQILWKYMNKQQLTSFMSLVSIFLHSFDSTDDEFEQLLSTCKGKWLLLRKYRRYGTVWPDREPGNRIYEAC